MKIITVNREFGSGGREIGKRLADMLGFAYYDKEIITEIARRTNLDEKYLDGVVEKGISNFNFHYGNSLGFSYGNKIAVDVLIEQQKIIKEFASRGDSVFVGRGADVILREYKPFKIFVYADEKYKIERCRQRSEKDNALSDKQLKKSFRRIDKGRCELHDLLSDTRWKDYKAYNLCVNTGGVDIKDLIPLLKEYALKWFESSER